MRADSVRRFIGITLSGYQPWRALGGEFGNLDGAGSVSILGAVTVGWREAGGRETGPQGARSACRGCRDGGWEGTQGGAKKPGTSKEHPRNVLATCLQLWGGSGGAMVLARRCWQEGSGGLAGLPGRSAGGDRVRGRGIPRRGDRRGAAQNLQAHKPPLINTPFQLGGLMGRLSIREVGK